MTHTFTLKTWKWEKKEELILTVATQIGVIAHIVIDDQPWYSPTKKLFVKVIGTKQDISLFMGNF